MTKLHDQLSQMNPVVGIERAFQVLNIAQHWTPAEQATSLSLIFLTLCRMYRVRPADVLELTERMTMDGDRKHIPEYQALVDYVWNELIKETFAK